MKVDSKRIKLERKKRAWSQEQLANVSGLGVRTIHRIEKSNSASIESVKALASVFEIEITQLQGSEKNSLSIPRELTFPKFLWILLQSPMKIVENDGSRRKNITRLFTMIFCLLGAIGSYAIGSSTGLISFVVLGFLLELALWFLSTEISRSSDLED